MSTTTTVATENEATILLRFLSNEQGLFSTELARSLVDLKISERDQERIHDLAVRNQSDALSAAEKEELFAFVKAGDMLSLLKARARRTLGRKLENRSND